MLGPNANLPWGGVRLTHHRKAPEFFYDGSQEIKKKADSERKTVPINQTGASENGPDEKNTSKRPNSKPGARKYNQGPQPQVPGWTLAEILPFVCKGHKKYQIEDLALLIKTLEKTTPDKYQNTFDELGESYRKEEKDYGITAGRWKALWQRYRDTLDKCIGELRRGDESLDGISSSKSRRDDTDSPPTPAASDTESETKSESPETGGDTRGADTDPTLQRPPASNGFSSGGSTGEDGSSRPEKRAFSAIQPSGLDATKQQSTAHTTFRQ